MSSSPTPHPSLYLKQCNVIVVNDFRIVLRMRNDALHFHQFAVVRVRMAARDAQLNGEILDVAQRMTDDVCAVRRRIDVRCDMRVTWVHTRLRGMDTDPAAG